MGKIIKKGMVCILLLGLCVVLIWIVPGEDEPWEQAKALQTEQAFSESVDTSQAEDCHVKRKNGIAEKSEVVGEEVVAIFLDKSEEKKESESIGQEPEATSVGTGNMGRETQENTGETSEESVGEIVTDSTKESVGKTAAGSTEESTEEIVADSTEESVEETSAGSNHESREESAAENIGESKKETVTDCGGEEQKEVVTDNDEEQENGGGTAGESIGPGAICQAQGHVFKVSIWETPTCLKGGYYNNICERCGLVECVTQPALLHEVEDITIQEGNCMEDTIIRHRCKHCGQQIKSDTRFTPQIHQWGSALIDGQQITYCEWCGITR